MHAAAELASLLALHPDERNVPRLLRAGLDGMLDAKSPGTTEFWDESLKLDDVLAILDGARAAAKFVVFDACRNELQLPTKDTSKGFIPVAEQQGMFIAYASKQGQTASDLGDKSGPYSAALAAELAKPGLDHLNLFQNVKETVLATTGGAQQPWESNGLGRRVYLTRRPAPTFVEPAVAQPQPDSTFGEANGIENALNLTDQERMAVKTALLKRRIDPGRIDTNFDFDARAAIKAWQYTEKRPVTGFLTNPELTELIGPRGQAHTSQDKIAISYSAPPAGADPRLTRAIPVLTGYPITYGFIDNHLLIAVAAKLRGGIKFDEARKLAERAGGTLATVESAAKNTAIFNLIKDDPRFWHVDEGGYEGGPWIGLFQTPGSRTSEEGWQWVSGSKTSYRNWDRKSGQPNKIRVGFGPGAAVFGGKFTRPTPMWTDIAIMRFAVPGCIIEIR